MTVAGILSGMISPAGPGYTLSRLAARIEPTRPAQAVPGRQPGEAPPSGTVPDVTSTKDILDLSPAALGMLGPADPEVPDITRSPAARQVLGGCVDVSA